VGVLFVLDDLKNSVAMGQRFVFCSVWVFCFGVLFLSPFITCSVFVLFGLRLVLADF
jgi:hypothetical protein